ncbi:DUF2510 domain-containing protein [Plantibacter cousiniae (nom. nud.)]|uniref:DUF2510 domain-containing protein n=1 Tax=Plantibacter cousiniae (nom. nud.) TaxID=199709 RepID=UPI00111797B4
MSVPGPPAGWYPHPSNVTIELYWDGTAWDGQQRPLAPPTLSAVPAHAVQEILHPHQWFVAQASQPDAKLQPFPSNELPSGAVYNDETFSALPLPKRGRVPLDCVWSTIAYPGEPPRARGREVPDRLQSIGQLQGLHETQILAVAGPPNSRMAVGPLTSMDWAKFSFLGRSWSVGLLFDRYGVCAGVSGEIGF